MCADLIEASDQGFRLLHHSSLHSPLGHSLYIILLVLLSHLDVRTSRLEFPLRHLATQEVVCLYRPAVHTHTYTLADTHLAKNLLVDSEG